jgi:hypothetical protein
MALSSATPPAIDTGCPIDTLPAELLEAVLLEVVGDPVPPIMSSREDQEIQYRGEHVRDLSATLAFRLTSKAFRDMSWRALGKVIGYTVFDLRSRKSVENLEAMSACAKLAPWVSKIKIACRDVPEYFPTHARSVSAFKTALSLLDRNPSQRLRQVKEGEQDWYPGLWLREVAETEDNVSSLKSLGKESSPLQVRLEACFRHLRNIEDASFHHADCSFPGRYRETYWSLEDHTVSFDYSFNYKTSCQEREGLNAHLGLIVFMGALATSGIQPQTLCLASDFDEDYAFVTHLSEEVVAKVCINVRSLQLSNEYYPFYDDHSMCTREPKILITNSTFPALQSLVIDQRGTTVFNFNASLPSLSEVPALTHLAILSASSNNERRTAFIERYGQRLQSFTFLGEIVNTYGSLFEALTRLRLKRMVFAIDPNELWMLESASESARQWLGIFLDQLPDKVIEGLADVVELRPPQFERALRDHWNE